MSARIAALLICVAVAVWILNFPFAKATLAIGAIVYLAVLLWRPSAWLLLLPVFLPLVQLAPWSGRVFFDEFDALVLLTLATALWHGRHAWPFAALDRTQAAFLTAFLCVYLFALTKGIFPWHPLDPNATANYYSNLNGLRAAKGLLWAMVLYSAWVAEHRINAARARNLLLRGIALGACSVVLVVLWERDVFRTLFFWSNVYAPIQAFLDFSTSYRVTALFADMHTGGTAIDGYLALVLPLVGAATLIARDRKDAAFFGLTFLGTIYVAMVTFSRGVYLGVGIAGLFTVMLLFHRSRSHLRPTSMFGMIASLMAIAAISFVTFRSGGTLAVAFASGAFVVATASEILRHRLQRELVIAGTLIALLVLTILSASSISSRQYNYTEAPPWAIAALSVIGCWLAGAYWSARLRAIATLPQVAITTAAIVAFTVLLTPSLLGFRMEARFDTVREDLLHRMDHWQTAVQIMNDDWTTTMLGQGLGRFPATYYWVHQAGEDVGGFRFEQEKDNQYLRFFGAHDVRLGQRLSLQPNTLYTLSLDLRTSDPAALLYLRICHRHLIHPNEWNPHCVQFKETVRSTGTEWQRKVFTFNSRNIGALENLLRAPLVFNISNRREYAFNSRPQTILDFDNLSIRDSAGQEVLDNGGFESTSDRWFPYYDFNHLPWHIKNLWVHMYFELGLIGLAIFVSVLTRALWLTFRSSGDSILAGGLLISIVSVMAVGTFGTLVDSPRIAFLLYFLLLVASTPEAFHTARELPRQEDRLDIYSRYMG
jgi:hypothetical protein